MIAGGEVAETVLAVGIGRKSGEEGIKVVCISGGRIVSGGFGAKVFDRLGG